jgi:hypothetical protein
VKLLLDVGGDPQSLDAFDIAGGWTETNSIEDVQNGSIVGLARPGRSGLMSLSCQTRREAG